MLASSSDSWVGGVPGFWRAPVVPCLLQVASPSLLCCAEAVQLSLRDYSNIHMHSDVHGRGKLSVLLCCHLGPAQIQAPQDFPKVAQLFEDTYLRPRHV